MNKMVQYMVELLFRDVEESDEVCALRDEVMANCQAHYDDMIRRGLSEDEAIAAVTDSLQGMEEVVSQYPRKVTDAPVDEIDDAINDEAAFADKPETDAGYDDAPISCAELNLKSWNATLRPSADGRVHVNCEGEGADHIETRFEGDRLIINEKIIKTDNTDALNELKQLKWDSFDEMVESVKAVTRLAFHSITNVVVGLDGDIVIEVPQTMREISFQSISGDLRIENIAAGSLHVNTTSGDVTLGSVCAEQITVRSTSGDIRVSAAAGNLSLSSMSGDIEFCGDCGTLTGSSVSGDVHYTGGDHRPTSLKLSSTSGDVDIRAERTGMDRMEVNTVSGDVDITLPADDMSIHAVTTTASGDTNIRIPDAGPGAACQITVKTMSGDIDMRCMGAYRA